GGSGPTYLGGWITAFCAFDGNGKWVGRPLTEKEGALSAVDIFGANTSNDLEDTGLVLDYSCYHSVVTKDIPHGYVQVNILIDDNGTEIPAKMTAGHIGMQVSSTDDAGNGIKQRNTVKPSSGWWIFITCPETKVQN
ncbi:hypothetical protein BGZ46_004306, partial [Entomortierella lignicola]